MKANTLVLVLGVLTVACSSGGSGLEENLLLSDAGEDDKTTFCSWAVDILGGEGAFPVCDGVALERNTLEGCRSDFAEWSRCDVTIGMVEACIRAQAEDPCNGRRSVACNPPSITCR